MPSMLILGAASDIALECLKAFSLQNLSFYLACRDKKALENKLLEDKDFQNINYKILHFDALDSLEAHQKLWNEVKDEVCVVLCAVGLLGDQKKARTDLKFAKEVIEVNFTGLVPILSLAANTFEKKRAGSIIVISSVAGLRGRASNYVYGSAKASMNAYLSGLRQRLHASGVQVMTVLPGYVATKMIAFKKTPKCLTAKPSEVAQDILKGYLKRRDLVYSRPFWKLIFFVVKFIPEFIFKRLKGF